MAHRRGEGRTQVALFLSMLDKLVALDALVRVIDAWIGSLDITKMRFSKAQAQRMGRPPYDSADLRNARLLMRGLKEAKDEWRQLSLLTT
jgi:hypothetical protein